MYAKHGIDLANNPLISAVNSVNLSRILEVTPCYDDVFLHQTSQIITEGFIWLRTRVNCTLGGGGDTYLI